MEQDKQFIEDYNNSIKEIMQRKDLSLSEKGLLHSLCVCAFDGLTVSDVLDGGSDNTHVEVMKTLTSLIEKDYLDMRWKEGYCWIYLPNIDFGIKITNHLPEE